jgi:hypothetical protein
MWLLLPTASRGQPAQEPIALVPSAQETTALVPSREQQDQEGNFLLLLLPNHQQQWLSKLRARLKAPQKARWRRLRATDQSCPATAYGRSR